MFGSLIVIIASVTLILPQCDGSCIWKGICYSTGDPEDGGKSLYCPYDGPGFAITDEKAQKILLNLCPDIFTNCKRTK